jgi:prophage antirepressor-like protein
MLNVFNHQDFNFTGYRTEYDKMYAKANEVAESLGYSNYRNAIYDHADNEYKYTINRHKLALPCI